MAVLRILRRLSILVVLVGLMSVSAACGEAVPTATVLPTTAVATTATPLAAQEMITAARSEIKGAVALYKDGKTDAAYEAAANVYLNRFENLEADLNKADPTAVPAIEEDFKGLRDGIKAGKPQADIETIATRLDASLVRAAGLLAH